METEAAKWDAYRVRTWQGWHYPMALSLMAVWFLISATQRGQQLTPALTLPPVRYGPSLLLLEVDCMAVLIMGGNGAEDKPRVDSGQARNRWQFYTFAYFYHTGFVFPTRFRIPLCWHAAE